MPARTIQIYLLFVTMTRFALSFIAATYATFLISRGLNLFEIGLVNFIFHATLLVCEIPTGAVADVFGRKTSFVISCFVFAVGMFLYASSHSFWEFALAECVSAVGMTFATGAFRAWLVDKIKHEGYTGSLGSIFVREAQLVGLFGIIGAIAGAHIAVYDGRLPWIAGGVLMLSAGILASKLLTEEYFVHQKFQFRQGAREIKETIIASIRASKQSSVVQFVLVVGLVQYFTVQGPNMQWQSFFGNFLRSQASLGYVYAGIALSLILGSMCARRFLVHCRNEKGAILWAQAAVGLGIIVVPWLTTLPWALGVFMAHEVARGLIGPLKDVYLNDHLPSKERATMLSFESMAHHVGSMAGLVVSGFLAEYLSIRASWAISGGVLVLAVILLSRRMTR